MDLERPPVMNVVSAIERGEYSFGELTGIEDAVAEAKALAQNAATAEFVLAACKVVNLNAKGDLAAYAAEVFRATSGGQQTHAS